MGRDLSLARGYFKKMVLADTIALESIRSSQILAPATNGVWHCLTFIYTQRIFYLDFSGYTDIARGLGLVRLSLAGALQLALPSSRSSGGVGT